MKKSILSLISAILLTILILPFKANSQCVLPVNARKSTADVYCSQTCTNISIRVQDLRQTTNYSFNDLPYYSFSYSDPTATELTILYSDDKFSNFISLPFDFCFYGQSMSSCVVGSNAVVTFDFANVAPCNNAWKLITPGNAPQNIPFMGTQTCSDGTGPKYPGMSIMLPYYDIDPSVVSASPNRKISHKVYGSAPCRRFVVSFYQIPLFGNTAKLFTGQAVMHEGTGIIDINLENKPVDDDASPWNQGRAILGLQKDATTAVTADSVNCKVFTMANKSFRFWPIGGTSLLDSVQFIKNGTVVGLGSIGVQAGEDVEIGYQNYCPTSNSDTLLVKSFFHTCNQSGEVITNTDTLIVNRNPGNLGATYTATPATCAALNGSLTINVPAGAGVPPLQYSINGGPFQLSNVFNGLAAGTYTIRIIDAGVCQQVLTATVPSVTGLTGTFVTTAASCPGVNNGTIIITPTSGTGPYQFSLNGGLNQLSNAFTNLAPATYNIAFTDVNSCVGTLTVTVTGGAAITATASSNDASCAGVSNGSITITPTSGTAPYQYSADGGPFQLSNTFTGLATGNHAITFKDVNGCTGTLTVFVGVGSGILFTTIITPPSCAGAANGSITVNPSSGSAPYNYSINGGPSQLSNVFTGLAAATYTIAITDASGCTGSSSIVMPAGTGGLTANTSPVGTSCPGVNNGSITINPTNGLAPYQYSLNGGAFQLSNIFSNLSAGTYTITLKDALNCSGTLSVTVAAGSNLVATSSVINPPCAGVNNGSITINPTTGTAPYLYSFNGGPFLAGNNFTGLAPGTYIIDFRDAIGCIGSIPVTLTGNTSISGTFTPTMPLCNGGNDGVINVIAAGGVTPYEYSINAGTTYQPFSAFTNISAGSYTIRIRDFNGCTFDLPVTITEPALLTGSAASTPSTCNATDGVITLTAGGGTPGYLYSINNGTSYQAGNTFNVAPGNYNNILIKDANGCTKPASVTVTLVDNMFLNAGADTNVCVGSGVTLQPQTNPETNIFNWTPAAGLSSTTIKNPVASPTDTATYYLDFSWGACNRKDTIRVNVLHKPIAYAGKDTAICYKTIALLKGIATNLSGPVTYAWTPAGMTLNPTAANTTGRPDSSQLFTLTVKDNYGCNFTVTDDIFVTMQPPVPAYAGNDTNALYGVPHQLFSSGGVNFLWSPASPLNNPFAQNPLATLTNDTYFNVQVTDVAGCIGNDGVFIKVYKGPTYYLPNAFTPNGDGLNDVFRPIPVGIKSTEYFRIFNRYGQMIFETTEWLKGWDGKYLGKTQPTGAYVWMIKGIDKAGKIVEMKGQVIIVH